MELFRQGRFKETAGEIVTDAYGPYVSYSRHEGLRLLAQEIRVHARTRHDELIHIVSEARSLEERIRAANLLNWAGRVEETVPLAASLLDDPEIAVRNDLARFITPFLPYVHDERVAEIVDATMRMQTRPSHTDRNKALYVLLFVLIHHPERGGRHQSPPSLSIHRAYRHTIHLAQCRPYRTRHHGAGRGCE